jgi:hypothetical protein
MTKLFKLILEFMDGVSDSPPSDLGNHPQQFYQQQPRTQHQLKRISSQLLAVSQPC